MDNAWFKKTEDGFLWKPVRTEGWLVLSLWLVGNLWYLKKVNAFSFTVEDALLNTAPFFIVTTIIFLIVVHRHCGGRWDA